MTNLYTKQVEGFLDAIKAKLSKKADKKQVEFTDQFYRKMPILELETLDPAKAAEIAMECFDAFQTRELGKLKCEISKGNESPTIILVNDDMPFLVDSITAELSRLNISPTVMIHPILTVERDKKGNVTELLNVGDSKGTRESIMYLQLPNLPVSMNEKHVKTALSKVLEAVRFIVSDWREMVDLCKQTITDLQANEFGHRKQEEVTEAVAFLQWLMNDNFIFFGTIDYAFDVHNEDTFSIIKGSENGLFELEDFDMKPKGYMGMPLESKHFALMPHLLEITKSNTLSVVHRAVQMDYIGLKRFNSKGEVIGERRFLGLFTSNVYYQSAGQIPIIRRKIDRVMKRANFAPDSHDGKALKTILEFAPRDELFQMSEEDVFNYSVGVLSVEANPQVHLFLRRDLFERFVSCMVFIPRDRFNTGLRRKVSNIIAESLGGEISDFYTQMTDSPLARLHLIIKTSPGAIPDIDEQNLIQRVAEVTYRWNDILQQHLIEKHGKAEGQSLFSAYGNAFTEAYINYYNATNAMHDIERIREVIDSGKLALALYQRDTEKRHAMHLKFYNPDEQAALSDILPMLENLGFRVIDENPFRVTPTGEKSKEVWVRDFKLELKNTKNTLDLNEMKDLLEEVLLRVWHGQADNDGFNALALLSSLGWREIMLLRAFSRYARQTGVTYSNSAMIDALTAHPAIAGALVDYFSAKFDPERQGEKVKVGKKGTKQKDTTQMLLEEIEWLLGSVSNLEEDNILRIFRDLITAAWRTNYYQKDSKGRAKDYISIKFDSSIVPELPLPRPYAEIFVYSRRVEGVHLRGGKVARGGLRWSDRREDYRTEVLGLMKAQMVKNAVIVPVGSKGGFVVKRPPADGGREAFMAEGIECYKMYLRGLLDITDNLVGGKVKPPKNVVRYDGDDPYLVVAADKGTATFSDYANSVSAEYDFWLGDAFASGGSVGYDHKVMGITARGGWVSVQRHFREMGIDTQSEDFTTIGIGDMSGDVFGNGMLLSEHIKLVGAFNHLHIFLDPNPDTAKSFAERKRLFEKDRSGWTDYQPSLISEGGGVYSRSDKRIDITPQVREMLQLEDDVTEMSPIDLISAMLKAPVDLLWNGGIGTYVKAESETHEQVGDRANNPLRVNGSELRCKVIGEGGNLGFTQLGRIEYATNGGRINTDAIDNSAGVDCSDHEVNIKIAFRPLLESGGIKEEDRNVVLESMTEEVGRLVLRDNLLQTQAISIAEGQGMKLLESQARMMDAFEQSGYLNRKVEFLPSSKQIAERKIQGEALTRPELAVLLSYAKMRLYEELLDSNFPDAKYLENDLVRYFPQQMRDDYIDQIKDHRLRREIIATTVTNSLVNRAGITFFFQIQEDTGLPACDIARAYIIARDAFDIRELWRDIEALDGKVPTDTQAMMYAQASRFLERIVIWLLRNVPQPLDISDAMARYADQVDLYLEKCEGLISDTLQQAYNEKKERYLKKQAPDDLAHRIARLEIASSALDVIKLSQDHGIDLEQAGSIYFQIGARLRLGWLRREASRMQVNSYWERLAAKAIISEMFDQQRRLAASVVPQLCDKGICDTAIDRWEQDNKKTHSRFHRFIEDLKTAEEVTFPMLVIALRNVEAIG